jgi:dienelactone hydrolase
MDHLGVRDFMVLGFCIGGPFIWNLLKRTGDRVVAAVPAQPSGYRPEMPDLSALPALAYAHYVLARAKSDDLGGNK